jgi:hypothetical protein
MIPLVDDLHSPRVAVEQKVRPEATSDQNTATTWAQETDANAPRVRRDHGPLRRPATSASTALPLPVAHRKAQNVCRGRAVRHRARLKLRYDDSVARA